MINRKRGSIFTLIAGFAVLALSSTAFACTVFKGKTTIQGDASSATSTVYGKDSGMAYCGGNGGAKAFTTVDSTNDVGVLIEPNNLSGCTNKLGVNFSEYDVNFVNFTDAGEPGFKRDSSGNYILNEKGDCMSPVLPGVVGIGKIKVDSGGFSLKSDGTRGSRSYNFNAGTTKTWTANSSSDASGVCVSDSNANEGTMVPILLVTV